jgi:hypothetical protein
VPRIELIPEVLYGPNDPIHWEVDNLPLKAILRRQNLINLALDNVIGEMRDAIGTQGSVANRLNQSIDADGRLKTSAIDLAEHSIEAHTDGDTYVRMEKTQSDKLNLIAEGATNVALKVFTDDATFIELSEGFIEIKPSSTVVPTVESPNIVKLNMQFPASAAHRHYYNLEPVSVDLVNPDYINYQVNSIASPYIEGSLRVAINGFRIFPDVEVYVPGAMVDDPWTLMSFQEDFENGLFGLSSAITEDDVIRIDFDIALV